MSAAGAETSAPRDTILRSCAISLVAQDIALNTFLRAYYHLLVDRARHECDNAFDAPLTTDHTEAAREEWLATMNLLTPQSMPMMPSFEDMWSEALRFLHSHRQLSDNELPFEDYSWVMFDEVEYFGSLHERITVLIFEDLRAIPELKQWVNNFIAAEPKYADSRSNFLEQRINRPTSTPNILPDLDRAVEALRTDGLAVRIIVGFFGSLVLTAANYLWAQDGVITEEHIGPDIEPLMDDLRSLITRPFANVPLHVRQQAARINIRGTFRLLLHDATTPANMAFDVPELHWGMFRSFVHGLHQTAVTHDCVEQVREVLEVYELSGFLM